MDGIDLETVKQEALNLRENHRLTSRVLNETETVRLSPIIDKAILDVGTKLVLADLAVNFWRYADRALQDLRKLSTGGEVTGLDVKFSKWLETVALPLLRDLPERIRVGDREDLITLIIIAHNRLETLKRVDRVQLPAVLMETPRLLETRLEDSSLLVRSQAVDKHVWWVDYELDVAAPSNVLMEWLVKPVKESVFWQRQLVLFRVPLEGTVELPQNLDYKPPRRKWRENYDWRTRSLH